MLTRRRRIRPPSRVSPWPFIGLAGLAAAFFLYAATPVVLDPPWWGMVLMVAVWLGFFVTGCRWFLIRPIGVAVLAGVAIGGWFGLVYLGAAVWGWA